VGALWPWLVKQIEWLSATQGMGRARRWHEAFRVGAVDAIAARLRATVGDAREAAEGAQGPGLAVVARVLEAERAALERYASEHLRLKSGRGLRVDAAAWRRGHAAGGTVKLP
jgi:hypothetical protein